MNVHPDVAAEFPELRLYTESLQAPPLGGKSPPELRERLRMMADRFRGAEAVALRTRPVPGAYRIFFRQIGLDPDAVRTPMEAVVVQRLKDGGFKSHGLLDDALTIAVMETGVPVWALDAAAVQGALEIRPSEPDGKLVVGDDEGVVAPLFGELVPGRGATSQTERLVLFSVAVAGVPEIHVEEALWTVEDVLAGAG